MRRSVHQIGMLPGFAIVIGVERTHLMTRIAKAAHGGPGREHALSAADEDERAREIHLRPADGRLPHTVHRPFTINATLRLDDIHAIRLGMQPHVLPRDRAARIRPVMPRRHFLALPGEPLVRAVDIAGGQKVRVMVNLRRGVKAVVIVPQLATLQTHEPTNGIRRRPAHPQRRMHLRSRSRWRGESAGRPCQENKRQKKTKQQKTRSHVPEAGRRQPFCKQTQYVQRKRPAQGESLLAHLQPHEAARVHGIAC